MAFLPILPWLLIFTAVVLILILEILVKQFAFAYRRPILYSLLVIVIITILASFLVAKTPFHAKLFQRAQEGRLPLAGRLYHRFEPARFGNLHLGTISEITEGGFLLEKQDGETLTVIITPKTQLPSKNGLEENSVTRI